MEQERAHPLVRFIKACLQSEGSLWLEEGNLNAWAKKYKADISSLSSLCEMGKIKKLTIDGTAYYTLPTYHTLETEAAYNVMRIRYSDKFGKKSATQIGNLIDEAEKEYGIILHSEQRKAVHMIVNEGFCVLTGGPGTGKTCTLKVAVYVLEKIYPGISLRFTAPTGKAARRITESISRKASTVQSELHLTYTKSEPDNFEGDILFIDESSMLDMETAAKVFKAVQNGQRIVLIGDTEQLPSVGPGAVLRDLLDSNSVPNTRLTKTFRQAEDSPLFANILLTKEGNSNLVSDENEFVIKEALGGSETLNQIADTFCQEVEKNGLENVVCLIPYRKAGEICSNKLNNILQKRINPKTGKQCLWSKLDNGEPVMYLTGDPVMQLENRDECANGDVGTVVGVEGDRLIASFTQPDGGKKLVKYWKSELPKQLCLGYAMSINKSQGSEYKTVVMCMTKEHKAMLTRNMLYTGITRAKKRVVYVHEKEATEIAMKNIAMYMNSQSNGRTTLFGEKLRFYMQQFKKAVREAA